MADAEHTWNKFLIRADVEPYGAYTKRSLATVPTSLLGLSWHFCAASACDTGHNSGLLTFADSWSPVSSIKSPPMHRNSLLLFGAPVREGSTFFDVPSTLYFTLLTNKIIHSSTCNCFCFRTSIASKTVVTFKINIFTTFLRPRHSCGKFILHMILFLLTDWLTSLLYLIPDSNKDMTTYLLFDVIDFMCTVMPVSTGLALYLIRPSSQSK